MTGVKRDDDSIPSVDWWEKGGKRHPTVRLAALQWYAQRSGADIYAEVPVSRAAWHGWPEDAGDHRIDGVAVADGSGQLLNWSEQEAGGFEERIERGAELVLAWCYVDRPALGKVEMGKAMFHRSYPEHGPLRSSALVWALGSNVDTIFTEYGIELIEISSDLSR